MTPVTRRSFLGSLALAWGWQRTTSAIGPSAKFRVGQLVLPGMAQPDPSGLRRLLWEIDKRTSVDVGRDPITLTPSNDRLFETPFLCLSGDRAFGPIPISDMDRLKRFVAFGGMLFIDSSEGRLGGAFEGSARQLVAELFPREKGLEPIPGEHAIDKSFYLIDKPVGRLAVGPLEAAFHDQRAVVIYSPNDLLSAFTRDDLGQWRHECIPGGETQRELAFRLGINVAMYALCLDYKTDQVHVPFILKRRKWKPAPQL